MAYEQIAVRRDGSVVTITLNRPDKLNAMTGVMSDELLEVFTSVRDDDDARAIVVTGAGRGFCAGQDLTEFESAYRAGERPDIREHLEHSYHRLIPVVVSTPKPVIAAVNGVAAGAGVSLAAACDIRIAAEEARFTQAFELSITGEVIDAETALEIGLVNRVVDGDALEDEVSGLAARLAAMPTAAIGETKALLRGALRGEAQPPPRGPQNRRCPSVESPFECWCVSTERRRHEKDSNCADRRAGPGALRGQCRERELPGPSLECRGGSRQREPGGGTGHLRGERGRDRDLVPAHRLEHRERGRLAHPCRRGRGERPGGGVPLRERACWRRPNRWRPGHRDDHRSEPRRSLGWSAAVGPDRRDRGGQHVRERPHQRRDRPDQHRPGRFPRRGDPGGDHLDPPRAGRAAGGSPPPGGPPARASRLRLKGLPRSGLAEEPQALQVVGPVEVEHAEHLVREVLAVPMPEQDPCLAVPLTELETDRAPHPRVSAGLWSPRNELPGLPLLDAHQGVEALLEGEIDAVTLHRYSPGPPAGQARFRGEGFLDRGHRGLDLDGMDDLLHDASLSRVPDEPLEHERPAALVLLRRRLRLRTDPLEPPVLELDPRGLALGREADLDLGGGLPLLGGLAPGEHDARRRLEGRHRSDVEHLAVPGTFVDASALPTLDHHVLPALAGEREPLAERPPGPDLLPERREGPLRGHAHGDRPDHPHRPPPST